MHFSSAIMAGTSSASDSWSVIRRMLLLLLLLWVLQLPSLQAGLSRAAK
jgi:hypothetical protein